MNQHIPLFKVAMSKRVDAPLIEVLHSGYIGEGPKVAEFEHKLGAKFNNPYCLALNSGTAGLQLALALLKIKNSGTGRHKVITTPLTCFATTAPILTMGYEIQWADVQRDTLNIDPESIEKLIGLDTAAICLVHWGGYPADLIEIQKIAEKFNVPIIEDGAHTFGATYKGTIIGDCTFTDYCMLSFQAIKFLTTGDGGCLFLKDKTDYELGKLLRWFGIDRNGPRLDMRCLEDIPEAGYKMQMNDIAAMIGLVNLEDVKRNLVKVGENVEAYKAAFSGISGIDLIQMGTDRHSSNWIFTILVEDAIGFARMMGEKSIMVSKVHSRIDNYSCVSDYRSHTLPNLDYVDGRRICFSGDTLIPLVRGKARPIRDLVNKIFFVYSYDLKTDKVVIGKAHSCRLTKKITKLLKVNLSNKFSIKCTEDHLFLLSNGIYKKACDLKNGDSLCSLYRRLYFDRIQVRQIMHNPVPKWQCAYELADEYNLKHKVYSKEDGEIRHHATFNNHDDRPTKIVRLSRSEHNGLHVSRRNEELAKNGNHPWQNSDFIKKENLRKSIFMKQKVREGKSNLQNPETRKKTAKVSSERLLRDSARGEHVFQSEKIRKMSSDRMKKNNSGKMQDPKISFQANVLTRVERVVKESIKKFGHCTQETYSELRPGRGYPTWKVASKLIKEEKFLLNHQVFSVEKLLEKEDVYDFAVDEYHNFAIAADLSGDFCNGVFVHNCIPCGWWVTALQRDHIIDAIRGGW